MFISNKYHAWYYAIVTNAQSRISNPSNYYERHHIIPKSLGGSNAKTNLVKLTAREHFVCHLLLVKFVQSELHKYKMKNAVAKFMSARSHQIRVLNSRQYQLCREYARECASYFSQFRQPRSPDSIQKAIKTNQQKYGGGSSRIGVKLSDEQKARMKSIRKQRKTYDKWMINSDPEHIKTKHREWAKQHSNFVHNNPSNTNEGKRRISLTKSSGIIRTPWEDFECRYDFEQHPICSLLGYDTVYRFEKGLDRAIKTRAINRANLPQAWLGKTWREVGFDLLIKPSW